jgi:PAS domain S-box-containing protein
MKRKAAELALRESEYRIRTFLDSTTDMAFLKDESFRHIMTNRALCKFYGKTESEIIGKTDFDLMTGKAAAECRKTDEQTLLSNALLIAEEVVGGRYYETMKFPVELAEGKKGIGAYIRDISERKRAEQEIEILARFPAENPNPVLRVEPDGKIAYANPASEALLRLWNCAVREYLPPDWRKRAVNAVRHSTSTAVDVECEERVYSVMVVPIPDAGYVNIYARDITERKRVEEALRESEDRFRSVYENSTIGLYRTVPDGTIILANPTLVKHLGYSSFEELAGRNLEKEGFEPSYERKQFIEQIESTGEVTGLESTWTRQDGSTIDIRESARAIRDSLGNTLYYDGTVEDITERKRTEEALRQSETRYRSVLHSATDAIVTADSSGIIMGWNSGAERIFGYSYTEAVGQPLTAIMPLYRHAGPTNGIKRTDSGGDQDFIGKTVELKGLRKDKNVFPIELSLSTWETKSGQFFTGIIRDITERKRSEEALKESQSLYHSFIEQLPNAVFRKDREGRYVLVNSRFCRLKGLKKEDFIGRTPMEVAANEIAKQGEQGHATKYANLGADIHKLILQTGKSFETEEEYPGTDGGMQHMHVVRMPVFDPYGTIIGTQGIMFDITERKKADEDLRNSNAFNELLLKNIPFGLDIVDEQGTILFMTDNMEKLLGVDALGQNCWSVYKDDRKQCLDCPLQKGIEFGRSEILETANVLNGRIFQINHIGIIYQGKKALLEIFVDVTEQRKLQNQFLQFQKIESIGTLAGGIAHDFNNLLGIILAYSSLLERGAEDKQKIIESSAAITKAVKRGAALVRQILTFARQTDVTFQSLSVPDFIHEIISMLEETFPKVIEITMKINGNIPAIPADHTQMHQVVLNLCVNARDAMPNGGVLTITMETVEQKIVRKRFPAASSDRYVSISVSDTGTGMDAQIQNRIFDPFFTTKEKGKGTGLGLSVVYGVMQTHHGFVDVESTLDNGTTFFLYLPVPPNMDGGQKDATTESSEAAGGTETILIVEDEEMLRNILQMLLESKGYHVYAAADGLEAVDMYKGHKHQIDLVLTDIGLPKMDGIEEFEKLLEINPLVKVMLASGFLEPDAKSELFKAGAKGFIQKPYSPEDMLRKIRMVLDMQ